MSSLMRTFFLVAIGAFGLFGCSQETVSVPVISFERPGAMSFACLDVAVALSRKSSAMVEPAVFYLLRAFDECECGIALTCRANGQRHRGDCNHSDDSVYC